MNIDYWDMTIASVTVIGLMITIAIYLSGEDDEQERRDDAGL